MRQYITVDQLNELAPEQKERLREWWGPQDYDVVYHPGYNINPISYYEHNQTIYLNHGEVTSKVEKEDCLPLLTIGQCIELLFDIGGYDETSGLFIGISRHYAEIFKGWCNCEEGITEGKSHILIDALWQAVKKVL